MSQSALEIPLGLLFCPWCDKLSVVEAACWVGGVSIHRLALECPIAGVWILVIPFVLTGSRASGMQRMVCRGQMAHVGVSSRWL
jgi:hypothetical protein